MASTSGSDEAKELELVGKVELRIALADTDEKLSKLLETYLAPLLLKLLSPHERVRRKILDICDHLQTRLRSRTVHLPVRKLLSQLRDYSTVQLIALFDKRFLERGIPRLSAPQQADLLPDLVATFTPTTVDHLSSNQPETFHFFLQCLNHYRLPSRGSSEDVSLRQKIGIEENVARSLSIWSGKLMLLNVNRNGESIESPGLSTEDIRFLTMQGRKESWDPNTDIGLNLFDTKAKVLQFLASGAFNDNERFLPALYASASTNSLIADRGDDILKHIETGDIRENSTVITELYQLYFQGAPRLKIRILTYFTRSKKSVSFPAEVQKVITEGLCSTFTEAANGSGAPPQKVGRDILKLRAEIFNFANFSLRNAAENDLTNLTNAVAPTLRQFIVDQGWPSAGPDEDLYLRSRAYELLGTVLQMMRNTEFEYLEWFFESLKRDQSENDVTMAIEQGLSCLISVYSTASRSSTDLEPLGRFLLRSMEAPGANGDTSSTSRRRTRYAAVRFANRCLPFSNVVARWIDILACTGEPGDDREIAEEGKQGLDPLWFKTHNSEQPWLWGRSSGYQDEETIIFPQVVDMVQYAFGLPPDESPLTAVIETKSALEYFGSRLPQALRPTVKFCYLLLLQTALEEADAVPKISQDWALSLSTAADFDIKARGAVSEYLKAYSSSKYAALSVLVAASLQAMLLDDAAGPPGSEDIFLKLLSLSPRDFLLHNKLGTQYRSLQPTFASANALIRHSGARAYGILFAIEYEAKRTSEHEFQHLLESIGSWESAVGQKANEIEGNVLALAFALSRIHMIGDNDNKQLHKMSQRYVDVVCQILIGSRDSTLMQAIYTALEQLSIFMLLPKYLRLGTCMTEGTTSHTLLGVIFAQARNGNEKAIRAVGRLAVCLSEDDDGAALDYFDEQILKMHEIRQTEAQFAVGEALACSAAGWHCTALQLEVDMDGITARGPSRERTLPKVLNRTIKDCSASKPSLRKASVFWLLSLLDYCGHLPVIQAKLSECQFAFKRCLADRNTLVQEAASRGLGLVYDKASNELKEQVVSDLLSSFTDNKPRFGGDVTEDTQLFEPGALPTGDGSISTYKDILNLASEVGDPSLVYRFMSLASSDAIWSSRAAFGRFGLSGMFAESASNYLAKNSTLYTKLYRYRFDPSPSVRRSMNDIWNAMIKDPNKAIEQHFDEIMRDLLKDILNREWRVREACCAAIADLVQGRKFSTYEKYLPEIWSNCFKVLDDIKQSVIDAAAKLARVLTNTLIHSLEAGEQSAKASTIMLQNVIPFLSSNAGIGSRSTEIQSRAIATIVEIIQKGSPKVLRPFLSELIDILIPLLDVAEGQNVEYLRMNAANYNINQQDIDDLRLKAVSASPLMAVIERCLDFLDDETTKDMAMSLEKSMKTLVALPSKIGCSRIIVSMATRHRSLFQPYTGRFLKLIQSAAMDRNDTVASSYAVASGYLTRLASSEETLQLAAFAKNLYISSEDDRHRALSGDFMASISKYASERFNSVASDLLPFIFVAKHDENEAVKSLYSNAWNEHVAGSRAVTLYLGEIVSLAQAFLDSPRWTIKHSAARAIADAAISLADGLDDISIQSAQVLWPALEKAVGGKTWDGKEVVVLALAAFVEKTAPFWQSRPDVASSITKIILREARRQNRKYQQHALKALSRVAAARKDVNMTQPVFDTVAPVVGELTEPDDEQAMDVDAGDGKKDDALRDQVLIGTVEAMQSAIIISSLDGKGLQDQTLLLIDLYLKANSVRTSAVSAAIFESLEKFFSKIDFAVASANAELDPKITANLNSLLFQRVYSSYGESIKLKRANAVLALASIKWDSLRREVLEKSLPADVEAEKVKGVRDKLEVAMEKVTS